ncbi:MAG: M48 family metallopeptidase [Nitrospirota bacterium]
MTRTPNALCFGHDLPGAGVPCRVTVGPDGLSIEFTDQANRLAREIVPFSALSIGAGGFDHDHLVLQWTANGAGRTVYLKDPTAIVAFRQSAPQGLTDHLERTAERVRRSRRSRRTVIAVSAASLLGLLLALWFGFDAIVSMAVSRIPVAWEEKIGETVQRDFLAGQTMLPGGPAVEAVQEITKRLTSHLPDNPYTFHVTVVRSDVVNAFALPGGYVVVFTGLLQKAENPEEVAGVLSHELNHVLQRHGLERIVKTLGVVAVVTILVGDQQGLIGLAKQLGVELLTLKFSREQETEADVTGLKLLHRAKIAPDGMIRFFERLSESESGRVELLSTHPMSAARAERLKAEAASLPRQVPEPFGFEWSRVQESLGRGQKGSP